MASDPAFQGIGWAFPPAFTAGGTDVQTVTGAQDIQESLVILLNTHAAERPFQENFGCDLRQFLYEPIDGSLLGRITSLISSAIRRHEARIDLHSVNVDVSDSVDGLVLIRLDYTLRGSNSRFNLVYPFYINESARSPA